MSKKVAFGARPTGGGKPADADGWVSDRVTEAAPVRPPMKRLTVDLPADVHARLKAHCAMRGVKMVDEIRAFVEEKLKT